MLGPGNSCSVRTVRIAVKCAVSTFFLTLGLQCPIRAQSNVQGQWNTLSTQFTINPIHAALLHNGKVLIVSGSGNLPGNTNYEAGIFDPSTGMFTTQPVGYDMFCNGIVVLSDGRAFINGGTTQYDPFHGSLQSSIYDPA